MSLPNELLIGIFTKLFYESSIKQFLNLRIICKRWNQIIPIVFIDEIKSFYENKLKCRVYHINI
uniref:F-box domain-containing protein n=1 Tax=Rhizophagus irregularis (strain DAOM 181602 / DAOM 197198 / MUCL 43194) TaxID=747089 RepID=U9TQL8_RHIID